MRAWNCLIESAPDSSASRIVLPVWAMKTSSSEGRATLTERIRHAQLGEQARHELLALGDREHDLALGDDRLEAEALAQRGDGGLVVVGTDLDPVLTNLRLQHLGRVERDDLALVHDRDPIAELGLVHVVGGHEDRDLLLAHQLLDVGPDRAARLRVEPHGGLVEEEHARRVQQAARDLQAALHPAGEGVDEALAPLPQPHHREHLLHALARQRARHAVELGVEAQVLLGAQVAIQGGVLEHEADVAAHVVALALHVVPGHAGRAAGQPRERAEHADRGRLARAVRPQEAEDLARGHLEIDAAHGLDLAVALGQPANPDGRLAAVPRREAGGGCGFLDASRHTPSSAGGSSARMPYRRRRASDRTLVASVI